MQTIIDHSQKTPEQVDGSAVDEELDALYRSYAEEGLFLDEAAFQANLDICAKHGLAFYLGEIFAYAPTLDGYEASGATPEEARERLLKVLYVRLTEMLAEGKTPPSDEGAEIINVVLRTSSP